MKKTQKTDKQVVPTNTAMRRFIKTLPIYVMRSEFYREVDGRLYLSVPVQMRMDDKTYKAVKKDLVARLKEINYSVRGGGCDGDFYDISTGPAWL